MTLLMAGGKIEGSTAARFSELDLKSSRKPGALCTDHTQRWSNELAVVALGASTARALVLSAHVTFANSAIRNLGP